MPKLGQLTPYLSCLLALPLLGQTSIGGGTCSSASLNGIYAISISGRQVTTNPAAYTKVFQSSGAATFDGLSKVTISLTANTNQAAATSLVWSGTYSVQANCAGVINVTTGGSATLNLALYASGSDVQISGSDADYTYSGSALTQPSGCSVSTFSGVYSLAGTGFSLSAGAVSGAQNGTGLLQFDGQGHVTVNITMSALGTPSSALTLTGTYAVSPTCLGSASLTDSNSNTYMMSFSISNMTAANTSFYVTLAQAAKFLIEGSGRALYGQPTIG